MTTATPVPCKTCAAYRKDITTHTVIDGKPHILPHLVPGDIVFDLVAHKVTFPCRVCKQPVVFDT